MKHGQKNIKLWKNMVQPDRQQMTL